MKAAVPSAAFTTNDTENTMSKRHDEINKILLSLGIKGELNQTANNHICISSDDLTGDVITSSTPSDSRSNMNLRSQLRKLMKRKGRKEGVARATEDQIAECMKMVDEGMNADQISEATGYGKSTIYAWKKAHKAKQKLAKTKEVKPESVVKGMRNYDDIDLNSAKFENAINVFKNASELISLQEREIIDLRVRLKESNEELEALRTKLHLIAETMGL